MQATGNANSAKTGHNVFRVGIVLQALSYFIFCFLVIYTHWHVKREGIASPRAAWWKVIYVLYISSLAIIVRLPDTSYLSYSY
jgi:hypothetical protein